VDKCAVVFTCSDPRLRDAADRIDGQLKELLKVKEIIPLTYPGMVGLYADRSILEWPPIHELKGDLFAEECQRMTHESALAAHIPFHDPCAVVIAGHTGCKGYPVQDQASAARIAAEVLLHRLRVYTPYQGPVLPATLDLCPNPGWKVTML
jgi:hypothetical protein